MITAAAQRGVDVEDVLSGSSAPPQRVVQLLKCCMLYFVDDPDNRPPSILITRWRGPAKQTCSPPRAMRWPA